MPIKKKLAATSKPLAKRRVRVKDEEDLSRFMTTENHRKVNAMLRRWEEQPTPEKRTNTRKAS